MCGRYTLRTSAPRLIELFQLHDFPDLEPRYNIAPTQLVACIRLGPDDSLTREAVMMRWGLVPFWAKDLSIGNRMINARAETVAEKPAFRQAWQKRRCLIPADGFYEWEATGGRKQPWLIHLEDHQPFAFAGLWESWKPAESDVAVLTCTILTTAANLDMQPIHDRMPVILTAENFGAWLSGATSPAQRQQLLASLPNGLLQRYKVSSVVNKPTHQSIQCVQPIEGGEAAGSDEQ